MVACKDCLHCRMLATCWICKKDSNGKIRSLRDLETEGLEDCPYFTNEKLVKVLRARP